LGGLVYAWINLLRFGNPLEFGYATLKETAIENPLNARAYSMNPLIGAYGLLLSAGEGLFTYYPLCALGLACLIGLPPKRSGVRYLFLSFFLLPLLYYSRYVFWHGGGYWGARFLVVAVPYLILPIAPLVEKAGRSVAKWARITPLVVAGMIVNLLGILINYNYAQAYLFDIGAYYDAARFPEPGIWIPYYSPLRACWDLLWSHTYPQKYFSYAPTIYFLPQRLDLILLDYLSPAAPIAMISLLAIELCWLYISYKRSTANPP